MSNYTNPEFEFIDMKEVTDVITTSVGPSICVLDLDPGNDSGDLDI